MTSTQAPTSSSAGGPANPASTKYWKQPSVSGSDDIVVIHVCDENRQVSKDFCCKRNILVKNMKYFERFLAENENGYDDIDISVHCDVEIFEWLMTYIHERDKPPSLEKSIVVSILISSEFLQMESLVDLCLEHIGQSLGDIIKLPIDLSCISEKLINKLAFLTHPKTLSQTKDRKDKILNKLYKRRVELDFSRKSGTRSGLRTIAASLTCCRYCGFVYLDSCVASLACRTALPVIDFRGRLARKHMAISGWSLTAYLKALHAGGMGWDAIYWHVWAACEVFQVADVMISALEVDRYTVEPDGLLIRTRVAKEGDSSGANGFAEPDSARHSSSVLFSLGSEEDSITEPSSYKLTVSHFEDVSLPSHITPTLNPSRPHHILPYEVLELMCSQMKYIAGLQHKQLIETTSKLLSKSALAAEEPQTYDFAEVLWGEGEAGQELEEERARGRSCSPLGRRGVGKEVRKQAHSLGSKRSSSLAESAAQDSDAENGPAAVNATGERRSRSSSFSHKPTRAGIPKGPSAGSSTGKSRFGLAAQDTRDSRVAVTAKSGDEASVDSSDGRDSQPAIFKSLSPEVAKAAMVNRGQFKGYWLKEHPLQLQPAAYLDMIAVVQESGLLDGKKLEWELDLLREYDEKKMERLESFLISKRNSSLPQLRTSTRVLAKQSAVLRRRPTGPTGVTSSAGEEDRPLPFRIGLSGEYYKDRGRQPCRISL